ncbi:QsdR family transcriptional regulator [Lentzea sp. BCCO 10_0856]|uniref:QsdR family transcriptional regulator n=1 Tax=Lentzea miocenica TaxID=3095431 RepID=A0ABU4T7Y8_9PSEU|nr:QsdR family transcriptional regulator [Lentzea sp. BCCO 10_0856]MDX8034179.1 QsdR family transcriptional regulator [Lentzea sp. BCCO 10_0856]
MLSHAEANVNLATEPEVDPVIAHALRQFLRESRIDMGDLAAEAGIGRATLYRRYGDRDRVLGEVLWVITQTAWARLWQASPQRGTARVVAVLDQAMRDTVASPALRALLERDPETALRVLTSQQGVVQHRLVAGLADLIRAARGEDTSEIPLTKLAYAVVRLAESFCYSDIITGAPPDIDTATDIIRKLLA